jgi:hypothetical protein
MEGISRAEDQNTNITIKPQKKRFLNTLLYQEILLKGIFEQETECCGLDYSASR